MPAVEELQRLGDVWLAAAITEGLFMRAWVFSLLFASLMLVPTQKALADIQVEVDVGSQTMEVYVNGRLRHSWRVSTGRDGFETPGGEFRAQRLEEEWYSKQYDDAPMPHAIFFNGGIAIHGTFDTRHLGSAVSHGCVRLAPRNAARLFEMVEAQGLGRTHVTVND